MLRPTQGHQGLNSNDVSALLQSQYQQVNQNFKISSVAFDWDRDEKGYSKSCFSNLYYDSEIK